MSTYSAKLNDVNPSWYLIDAEGKNLGRLASHIAIYLRGKHKPEFTPHMDMGDYVVVINADKIQVTGKKLTDKFYHRYTGYQSGLKSTSLGTLLAEHPARAIQFAVKGMLPKGPLGRQNLSKLKVYAGADHPHVAQQPKILEIEE